MSGRALFIRVDSSITRWMARYGLRALRISLGVVFFWFGFLKFIPGLSPAEGLAAKTLTVLSAGLIQAPWSIYMLATWECLIGLGLLTQVLMRTTLFLLFLQMLGTLTPLFLFPEETFIRFPFAPTLEGQYIIKNLVLVSAGLVIGATVRGGGLVPDPDAARTSSPSLK